MGKPRKFNSYDSDVRTARRLVEAYGKARQDKSGITSSFNDSPTGIPQGQSPGKADETKLSLQFGGELNGPIGETGEVHAIDGSNDLDISMTGSGEQRQIRPLVYVSSSVETNLQNIINGRIYPGQKLTLTGINTQTAITISHAAGGAGQILCPGDSTFTLNNDESVLLQDDITAGTQTWRIIAISESAAAAAAASSTTFVSASLSADQTANIAATDHIEFDTKDTDGGIVLQTGAGQLDGIFELKQDRTYKLSGQLRPEFSGATGELVVAWYDITNATELGKRGIYQAQTNTDNSANQPLPEIIVEPTTDVTVELRIISVTALTALANEYCIANLLELGSGGTATFAQSHVVQDSLSLSLTQYTSFGPFAGFGLDVTENIARVVMASPQTLKTLYIEITGTLTGGSYDATIRRNSADLSPTKTVNITATGTHIIPNIDQLYSAGDFFSLEFDPDSPTGAPVLTSFSAEWELSGGGGGGSASFPLNYPVDRQGDKSGTVTHDLDLTTGHKLEFTATGDCDITISNIPTSASNGFDFYIEVTQDNPGLHAITFNDSEWDPIPVFGTAADTVSLISVHADGDGKLRPVLLLNATITTAGATTELDNLGTTSINTDLLPDGDATRDLGTSALEWQNLFVQTINATATTAIASPIFSINSATINLGDAITDSINFLGRQATDLLPIVDATHDLGSSALAYAQIYVDEITNAATVAVGSPVFAINSATISFGDAITDAISFLGRIASDVLPIADATHDLGSSALAYAQLYVDTINNAATTAIASPVFAVNSATISFGDAITDSVSFLGRIASDVLPIADATHDLGSSALAYAQIYVDSINNAATTAVTSPVFAINSASIVLGDAITDNISFLGRAGTDLLPITDSTFDLGRTAQVWAEVWADAVKTDGSLSFTSASGFDFSGGDTEFNDNSLTGVFRIDLTTEPGAAVASIFANDAATDSLDIQLGAASDLFITDSGATRARFDNTLLTWEFDGASVLKLPQATEISDRTTTPSTPSTGQAVLYVFDDGTAQPNQFLRIRFANGEIKTIADDIP